MVIQHTGCGMLDLPEGELKSRIKDEAGVEPSFELGAFSDLEENLARSVAELRTSRFLPHPDEVRGFIYDLSSGILTEVSDR
jgi:carbonic anhydrase